MKSTDYYVSVSGPSEVRRSLLAASKETLFLLKNYQKILSIRAKKLEALEALKRDVKELTLLMDKLADILPSRDFADEASLPPVSVPPPGRPAHEKPAPGNSAELARLEDALNRIETKLKGLK